MRVALTHHHELMDLGFAPLVREVYAFDILSRIQQERIHTRGYHPTAFYELFTYQAMSLSNPIITRRCTDVRGERLRSLARPSHPLRLAFLSSIFLLDATDRLSLGSPPDLGISESELLSQAFDEIVRLISNDERVPCLPPSKDEFQSPGVGARGIGGPACMNDRYSAEHQGQSECKVQFMRALGDASSNNPRCSHESGGVDVGERTLRLTGGVTTGRASTGTIVNARPRQIQRVPASEIMRLLHEGKLEWFRRASPSLKAICIFPEFSSSLEGTVSDAGNEWILGRKDARKREFTQKEETERGPEKAQTNIQGGTGLTKDEFCEFFEAITDLVDLNELSLVPRGMPGGENPRSYMQGVRCTSDVNTTQTSVA